VKHFLFTISISLIFLAKSKYFEDVELAAAVVGGGGWFITLNFRVISGY
jgi:uncharacterized membrane protein YagU involved in acid resistance